MTTITIEKSNFTRTKFLDEKDLFLYVLEYMQDVEDKNDVLEAMKKDNSDWISLNDFVSKYGK